MDDAVRVHDGTVVLELLENPTQALQAGDRVARLGRYSHPVLVQPESRRCVGVVRHEQQSWYPRPSEVLAPTFVDWPRHELHSGSLGEAVEFLVGRDHVCTVRSMCFSLKNDR